MRSRSATRAPAWYRGPCATMCNWTRGIAADGSTGGRAGGICGNYRMIPRIEGGSVHARTSLIACVCGDRPTRRAEFGILAER